MNKEIKFRIKRIIIVILFLIIANSVWIDANNNMIMAKNYEKSLTYLDLVELSSGINIDAIPTSDEVGKLNDSYKFKVVNYDDEEKEITIGSINTLTDNYIEYKNIRYQIIKNGKVFIDNETLNDDGIFFTDIVEEENTYELRFWISEEATFDDILDKSFSIKIALL